MKTILSSKFLPFFLALPFVGLYFIVRSLPVEPCDFLHEETFNLEGELDYCGPGDAGFVDLSIRRWPMSLDFRALDPLEIGKPCRFEMNIKQADGSPLSASDVALSHTRKIHLLAIDPSLQDYQHLHPEADPLFNGIWRFTLTPKKAGTYQVFLDLIPIRSPRRVLLQTSFEVSGKPEDPYLEEGNTLVSQENRTFKIKRLKNEGPSSEIMIQLTAVNEQGDDLPLRPVMGAFAHMVAFEANLKGFAHLHPLEYEPPKSGDDARSGPLTFSFKSPDSGIYRLWAQVKVGDDKEECFLPFDLKI